MGKFTVITGGARSGKSDFALELAEKIEGRRIFAATARVTDPEMLERIERHRRERGSSWETFEEPLDLVFLIEGLAPTTELLLIDCITVWTTNLMIEAKWDDQRILGESERLGEALLTAPFDAIVVTNEVGLGIVPESSLGRRFRDLAGAVNRRLAEKADRVYLVSVGLPLQLKGENPAANFTKESNIAKAKAFTTEHTEKIKTMEKAKSMHHEGHEEKTGQDHKRESIDHGEHGEIENKGIGSPPSRRGDRGDLQKQKAYNHGTRRKGRSKSTSKALTTGDTCLRADTHRQAGKKDQR